MRTLLTRFRALPTPVKVSYLTIVALGIFGGIFVYSLTSADQQTISDTATTTVSTSPTTPAKKPDPAPAPAPPPPPPPAPAPAPAPAAKPVPKPAPAPAPVRSASCTNPVFTTSDTNGGWSTNGYYVHNNMWNASEAGPETLYACSYKNWYVVSRQQNLASNPGSVKTYPNVHKDYNNKLITSFPQITSTFAASSPHLGIYNVAYDIWINGVASAGSTEVMIWTENYNQVPSGSVVGQYSAGGITYNVWKTSNSRYIAFVPTQVMTSGSIDIKAMLTWIQGNGWLTAGATLGQICYGVEIVSTNNTDATFTFTDFSIQDS